MAADIDAQTAHDTAASVEALGRRSLPLEADLGAMSSIDALVARAVETFGRIDILVNNAGVTKAIDILDVTPDDWGLSTSLRSLARAIAIPPTSPMPRAKVRW